MSNFFYRNLKKEYPLIASGKGVWLSDKNKKSYLDGSSGAVVSNIGHGVVEINEAINKQLSKIAFAHSSQFVSEQALELAAQLIDLAPSKFKPGGRVYFTSGGSESVETSLKMARAYFYETGAYQKQIVISRQNSYHGSTLGALSATGHPARRKPYLPILADNPHLAATNPYRCPCGSESVCTSESCGIAIADELETAILKAGADKVMAFIAEPIVGAALGAVLPHPGYFKRIRDICKRHNVLFIADEVMTGLSRTGADFALSHFGIEADIIVLGKGLSAGYMPLGAVLASNEIARAFEQGTGVFEHGFTYSAHPLACATGLAVLNFMQKEKLKDRVLALESKLEKGLSNLYEYDLVGNIRGKGFLWGIEFVCARNHKTPYAPDLKLSQKIAIEAARNGLLVYPGTGSADGVKGDHIIVAPPFTISEIELAELFARLMTSLKNVSASIPSTSRI